KNSVPPCLRVSVATNWEWSSRAEGVFWLGDMYFFAEEPAIPIGKWESVWRFFAGPFNFLF
ncbi:MAG: hypothetical protein J4N84_08190, partial [Chloroflexi bacterium]|nr:hypothetical protein [Chloroflexota bacterium]